MTGCVVSPFSWGHHWVWIVPFAIVVLRIALPRLTSDAAPLPAPLVRYARILAVAGALIFYATPYWLVPHNGGAEQNWSVLSPTSNARRLPLKGIEPGRIEPARPKARDFKSRTSTNSVKGAAGCAATATPTDADL